MSIRPQQGNSEPQGGVSVDDAQILAWLDESESPAVLPSRTTHQSDMTSPFIVIESFAALNRFLGDSSLRWDFPATDVGSWYRENSGELSAVFQAFRQESALFREFGIDDPFERILTITPQLRDSLVRIKATLGVEVKWVEAGKKIEIELATDSRSVVPGVQLQEHFEIFDWRDRDSSQNFPVVAPLQTPDQGSQMYLMKRPAHLEFSRSEDLYDFIRMVSREMAADRRQAPGTLQFPMADVKFLAPISGVIGATSGPYTIESAELSGRFAMNEIGARADFVYDMMCSLGVDEPESRPSRDVIIDGPFIAWFSVKDSAPYLAIHVGEEDMREPVLSL